MSSDTVPTAAKDGAIPPPELTMAMVSPRPMGEQFDIGVALLRLVVGGMLFGAGQLRDRLRGWEEASYTTSIGRSAPPQAVSTSLRHTLIGMAFETEARMQRAFSALLARATRVADDANLAYTRLTLSARGTPLDLVRRRLDELVFLALTEADRWTARGAREEEQGRRMAEQAAVGVIDELLDYMARNPEVRHLIEQQGASMAGSTVDELRERTASADLWIERLVQSLLHRPTSDKRDSQAKSARTEATPQTAETSQTTVGTTGPTVAPAAPTPESATVAPTRVPLAGDSDE